jgi:hypothetical protein
VGRGGAAYCSVGLQRRHGSKADEALGVEVCGVLGVEVCGVLGRNETGV